MVGGKIEKKGEKETIGKWSFNPADKLAKKNAAPITVPEKSIVRTIIDDALEFAENGKGMSAGFTEISSKIKISAATIDRVGRLLEKDGIVNVVYPASPFAEPKIIIIKKPAQIPNEARKGEPIEHYSYYADNVPVESTILLEYNQKKYFLRSPGIGGYTMLLLESLKERAAELFAEDISELSDAKKSIVLKQKFMGIVSGVLGEIAPELKRDEITLLSGVLLHEMYGLGRLELLMADSSLEEIGINSSQSPVTVYHRKHGWMKTNISIGSEDEVANYASQIARKIGRDINVLSPILDAHLLTGDRVSATLFPVSSFGNTITIRKFARKPWTMTDLISEGHSLSSEMAALLWLAIQYEMNVLVAGGTASGKTSMLNALCTFLPSYHRVISIEDVREIMLPSYLNWNWVPMNTREPNTEGTGAIKMLDLLQASLRMRPDRIILGEMRKREEAEVLFEAMHTGHSVYSTIHANSGKQVVRRLTEPPISLPPIEIEAIDLIVVQYRDRRSNARRTYEICSVEQGINEASLDATTIYRWIPRNDSWDKVNEPRKFIEQLNLHTGMTEREITEELGMRSKVLDWMIKQKISDIEDVGRIIGRYYSDKSELLAAADKNSSAQKFLE